MKRFLCLAIVSLMFVGCSQTEPPTRIAQPDAGRIVLESTPVIPSIDQDVPGASGIPEHITDAFQQANVPPTPMVQEVPARAPGLLSFFGFGTPTPAPGPSAQTPPTQDVVSPDGTKIITVGGAIAVVREADSTDENGVTESGKVLHTLIHTGVTRSADFSPDGTKIATGDMRGNVRFWDAESGAELKQWMAHPTIRCCDAGVMAIAFSPDGTKIATGGRAGTAKIWDTESGSELQTLTGLATTLNSVAFSPDGQQIITGSGGAFRTWDAETGRELR